MRSADGGTPRPEPLAPGPIDAGIQVNLGPRASDTHPRAEARSERRRGAVRGLAVAGGAVVAIGTLAVGLFLVRGSIGSPAEQRNLGTSPASSAAAAGAGPVGAQQTGPAVQVTTAQGDSYAMAAVGGGGVGSTGGTPAPGGQVFAYADYVLTNRLSRPVLLNLPADLFVRIDLVPKNLRPRCIWQAGVPQDMCTLPNVSKVIGFVNGSRPPVHQDADDYLPAHASYLVRIIAQLPVANALSRKDLGVYVWNALYVTDQQARPIAFPSP